MKKILIITVALIFLAAVSLMHACTGSSSDYVRIHIRANSDSDYDQQIKLEVRDSVVACLAPLLADCKNATQAKNIISSHLKDIETASNEVLSQTSYTSKALFRQEYFLQKSYGDLTLKEGNYDALIVELGTGEGANWWCVAYPPLCFVPSDEEGTVYKSKIMEIIEENKDKDR